MEKARFLSDLAKKRIKNWEVIIIIENNLMKVISLFSI
jgi:hypothetical protein